MAHELEIDQNTGRVAAAFGSNISAWHRLGTVLPGGLTSQEALEKAFLSDWDVRKSQSFTYLDVITDEGVERKLVEVPGQFSIVRNNPFTRQAEVLGAEVEKVVRDGKEEAKVIRPGGTVGMVYQPWQNEQSFEFLAAVTDEYSDAEFETAGSIRGGTQVFVTMKLKNFKIGEVDEHMLYLAYITNHINGSNVCFPTNTRVVCANTVDWALSSARHTFRHSASIEARHEHVRRALKMSWDYDAMFQANAEAMLREQCDLDTFRAVCDDIWPQPADGESDTAKRKWAERRQQLRQLFVFADTQEDIRFTNWGAYNAIVEYDDHFTNQIRAKNKAEARALRTIEGTDVKARAFELLKV